MSLEDVLSYFDAYDRSSYLAVGCADNRPSEEEVSSFESSIGFRLPDDFRDFTLSPLGGLYFEVRDELWRRPKAYEVGPFWTFLYGIKVFGIASDIPEWLDIRAKMAQFEGKLIPFLQLVGDADCYCFNKKGEIVKWSHEEPEEPEAIELTFSGLLMREIRELEIRKHCKVNNLGLLDYKRELKGGIFPSSKVDVFLERKPTSLNVLLKIKKVFVLETSIGELKRLAEDAPSPIAKKMTYIQAIRRCVQIDADEKCLSIRLSSDISHHLPIDPKMIP